MKLVRSTDRSQAQQSHYGHHVKVRQRRRVEVWFVKRRVAQAPAVQAG